MARPSKYKPEFNQLLIEHMKSGMSFESFGKIAKCSIETLYNWTEQFPEFLEAKKEAFMENRHFWDNKAVEALTDITEYNEKGKPIYKKSINPTILIFNLKNRFPEQWRDVKQLDQKQDIKQTSTISIDNADLILMNDLLKDLVKSKE